MEGDIKSVLKYWMNGEINNFIKVWISAYVSLSYCYLASKVLPKNSPLSKLLAFLPVIFLFLLLPLKLHSMHLGGLSAFFLAWLANFKLLMFAFNGGPLSEPSISLLRFIALACLPIKLQQNSPKNHQNGQKNENPLQNGQIKKSPSNQISEHVDESVINHSMKDGPSGPENHQTGQKGVNPLRNGQIKKSPSNQISEKRDESVIDHGESSKKGRNLGVNFAVKGVLLGLIIKVYYYSELINPTILLVIYSFHIYFCLELLLGVAAGLARWLLGLELEPQFNQPHLSSSLQDFWGRRWNIMVNRILRPTVYEPVLRLSTRTFGRKWAPFPAVFSTFIVSGLMHELIFYYLGRVKPTWEITWFFLLHGVSLMFEVGLKKAVKGRCRLPRIIGTILTVGWVMVTAFWLFYPQLLRCNADVRAFQEYKFVGEFIKDVKNALISSPNVKSA